MKPAHGGYYALLTAAAGAAVLFGPRPLAVAGGLPLALVLPGLAVGEAVLRGRKLARVERVVLAPALSLAVLVLAGLVVYGAGFRLERVAWTSATVGVTLAGLIGATVPKAWTAAVARLAASLIDEEPDEETPPMADAMAAAVAAPAAATPGSAAPAIAAAGARPDTAAVAALPAATPAGVSPDITAITVAPDITAITVAPDITAITVAPDITAITVAPDVTAITVVPDGTAAGVVARPADGGNPGRGMDDTVVLPVFVPDEQTRAKPAGPAEKPGERAAVRPPRRLVWQAAPLLLVVALLGAASWLSYTSSTKSYATTVTALSAGAPGPVNPAGTRSVAVRVTGLVAADGPYHLVASGSTGSTVLRRTIDVAGADTWSQSLELPGAQRVTVNLYRSGDSAAYRTLYISPAG